MSFPCSGSTASATSPRTWRARSPFPTTGPWTRARVAVRGDDAGRPALRRVARAIRGRRRADASHRFLARLAPILRERAAPADREHELRPRARARVRGGGRGARHRRLRRSGSAARTLLASPAGEAPRPIDVPNTYATELSLERRTILLKLHGAVDPLPEREWESFVITEDDYIDYLGHSELTAVVPVASGREAATESLPVPRLRDGRLEPAPDPQPALGPATDCLSLVGRAAVAEPAGTRSGGDTTWPRWTSSPWRTSSCCSGGWRWHEGRHAGIAVQGAHVFEDSELDALLFFGRARTRSWPPTSSLRA